MDGDLSLDLFSDILHFEAGVVGCSGQRFSNGTASAEGVSWLTCGENTRELAGRSIA